MGKIDYKALFEEIEHLITPDVVPGGDGFETSSPKHLEENSTPILGGWTNDNIKYGKLVIRVPIPELAPFFNRKNEYYNVEQANKFIEITEMPLYFNMETGLKVQEFRSPEIYMTDQDISFDYIALAIKSLNQLNGHGIQAREAFNMEEALDYFKFQERTDPLLDAKTQLWVQNFYKRFFKEHKATEFSHNDPTFPNFTITEQIIDFEYSGMAPVLSDLCNMHSFYIDNLEFENFLTKTEAPFSDMQPLVIFWMFFWGQWRLSKGFLPDNKTEKQVKNYQRQARLKLNYARELLDEYMGKRY